MAGVTPFFITGANAKIKVNGKTLAFCIDLQYSIQVLHQTPKVLGMYEGTSVEPLGYSVEGGFTIVRYAKDIKKNNTPKPRPIPKSPAKLTSPSLAPGSPAVGATTTMPPPPVKTITNHSPPQTDLNDAGNGIGNWGSMWGGKNGKTGALQRWGVGNDGRAHEAFNPGQLDGAVCFDIEVYQKAPNGEMIGVAKLREVRIVRSDFQLTKKGVAIQKFTFVAQYADEDSFAAEFSGRGQHF